MASITTSLQLTASGHRMDTSPECFGELRRSEELSGDAAGLRQRMEEDGYLYLPGWLDRAEVLAARRVLMEGLAEGGYLDPAYPPMEGVMGRGDGPRSWNPDLFSHTSNRTVLAHNEPLYKLLYGGRMMEFYRHFLGGEVRHFDFTWLRIMFPGAASPPHCDIVYMGRGTTNLYTSWTPLGDIPYKMGGLIILENSHRHEKLKANYGRKDVDSYCVNRKEGYTGMGGGGNIANGGALSHNPVKLRERLGGRWLTTEFKTGDLLVFSMFTVHASVDNQSDRIRLSSDSRYQLASDPVDDRWIGESPSAHGAASKRGFVC